ncbi:MAG: radical SAM protein [Deltaproteobacteria bacterium]|nr:radical SAM protein [Deltaproteobacteria bacterium]MBI3294680.1 radical SAM protein [Deltaproteobacteria bacterium]
MHTPPNTSSVIDDSLDEPTDLFDAAGNRRVFVHRTEPRPQIKNLDALPVTDRTLISYSRYHRYIGHAGVKHSIAIQASRGCPYRCFYCDVYKSAEFHFRRPVDHLFEEVKRLYDIGIRRIEFIDDIFNVHKKQFNGFFEEVLKHNLKLNFYFPTGLKGDLLEKDTIDLMVEAGARGVNLSLEHAAPRMQKVMRKNLKVDKLHENLVYITEKHPIVILTLNAMHGFPTETQEEALQTLDYIKSIRWIHFPYLHNVRIFPGTELEHFALEQGVPRKLIKESYSQSYHEIPTTLPFPAEFTRKIRTSFLMDYVLNRDRLLKILPYQMEQFSEDEINQRCRAYFPTRVNNLDDLLKLAKIDRSEIVPRTIFREEAITVVNLEEKLKEIYPPAVPKDPDALRVLLIEASPYFTTEADSREYAVFEPPLGLMALLTYVNEKMAKQVNGKIIKARIDFDSYEDLVKQIKEFNPDVIGMRIMTFYQAFFRKIMHYLRSNGIETPVVVGGPYPTASFEEILEEEMAEVAVIAEGERVFVELLEKMLENNKELPPPAVLKTIQGIAYRTDGAELSAADLVTEKGRSGGRTRAKLSGVTPEIPAHSKS